MTSAVAQSEFWSKVATRYDTVVDLQIGSGTRAMVRERLTREDHLGTLAEFGCGTGFYTETLARKADRVVATDLSAGMLAVSRRKTTAANVQFQEEDCQRTSFPDAAFDTVFMSLLIHFTDPPTLLREMHRILKSGGTLIIANLDPKPLTGWARVRCRVRVIFHGITRYRLKPPKGFGDNVMTEQELCDLLSKSGFNVISRETFRNPIRSSNIPVQYIKAVKV